MTVPAQDVLGWRGNLAKPDDPLLPAADVLAPVASRSLFWHAKYLQSDDFLEHLPFAFWLVETCRPSVVVALGIGRGVAYFGFCQAIERLGIDSSCFGLDAWADSQQVAQVSAYNADNYGDFSRLLDGDPLGGADRFQDGQIDLLHVNLPLGAKAVEVLEREWLRKLSESGVILLHNLDRVLGSTEARGLVDRLGAEHRNVHLDHGNCLLLLLHGQQQPARLETLAGLATGASGFIEVRRVFSRLGRGFQHEWSGRENAIAAAAAEQRLAENAVALAAAEADRETLSCKFNDLQAAYDERMRMVGTLQARLFDLQSEAMVGAASGARVSELEQLLKARDTDVARTTAERDDLRSRLIAAKAETGTIEKTFRLRLAELEQSLKTRETEAARIVAQRDDLRTEIDGLKLSQALSARRSAIAADLMRAHLRREADLKRRILRRYVWTPPLKSQVTLLHQSDLFDAVWYRDTYRDLMGMSLTPEEHYIRHGACEGRNPGPNFDSMSYYIANPDVARSGMAALVHYIAFGRKEGRALELIG